MNKRAAAQYLDTIFGTRQGYVAVAYKDRGQSWQECQFAWPADRNKLIGWAEVHQDANIFVCPALRQDGHTRRKGDMQPSEWLWADVDWQAVPPDRVADVKARIMELGSIQVKSGTTDAKTGRDNLHVYVKLNRAVSHEEFIKLNTGLRDYLYADNKQADNSLLRLPGTTNWKTDAGAEVSWSNEKRRLVGRDPANLMKLRAFRDAKVPVEADASEWSFVELEDIPRRVKALVNMPVDEALGRYGKRYKAVRGVVNELHRRGFDQDQIHSLMDKFPPALSKAAEENGYDLHLDIDRCLAVARAVDHVDQELREEVEDAFQELDPAELEQMDADEIERWAELEYKRSKARKRAREMEAERSWVAPPESISWSLTDALKNPPQPVPQLIDGLCGIKHNVVLTAQYKTGKTAFTMGSIVQALADGTPFLDRFEVNTDTGLVVGHWNCEMDPNEMMDDYIRPVGLTNTDNLHVANLRGYAVNILSEMGRAWAVQWLTTRAVKVWTIDSFARLARMAGVSEKDNDEVMSLLMALDQIKVEADVDVLFLITHTGRAEQEEGKERARGATAIDDWADARWIMTKMDKTRFLRVEGRGVRLDDTALIYDEDTKRSVAGFGGKTEVLQETAKDAVVKLVHQQPGIVKSALLTALRGVGISARAAVEPIEEAIEGGFIEVRKEQRRGKSAICHYPAGSLKGETRMHAASPADVDMRAARPGRRIRRT